MLLCLVKVHLELKLSLVINANDIVIQCSVIQTIKEEKERNGLSTTVLRLPFVYCLGWCHGMTPHVAKLCEAIAHATSLPLLVWLAH